jgi:CHAT domain
VRYVHEVRTIPSPKPEVLRVLYLTANPKLDLRTEVEVRNVRQAVRTTMHRDLIEIIPMPAATPEDLLDGLNDVRPHVVHLSSHAGEETVIFDNASIESPAGRKVTFDLLAKALGATDDPPVLLVLNGCDTLDGAEVLLESTPVIIAMASDITDRAASVFATRFYSAIASAQPVGAAVRQGAVAMEFAGTHEGGSPPFLLATTWSLATWCWSRSYLQRLASSDDMIGGCLGSMAA